MPKILRVTRPKPSPFGEIIYAPARLSQDEAMYQIWTP